LTWTVPLVLCFLGVALPEAARANTLTATPTSVQPGQQVTVSWSITSQPTSGPNLDWIGLYVVGAPNTAYLSYQYATGQPAGQKIFTMPQTLGTYEFRYLPTNGYVSIATSNPVVVGQGAPPPHHRDHHAPSGHLWGQLQYDLASDWRNSSLCLESE